MQFASIDWHDFLVVGTVTFGPEDETAQLPPPVTMRDMTTRALSKKSKEESVPREQETSAEEEMEVDVRI